MLVKLVAIPLFAFNFVLLVSLFLGGLGSVLFGGAVLWVIGAVGVSLNYLTMLSTSIYSWAAVAQLRRERIVGIGLTVLYAIMCLLFFTDVAAAVLLFGHSRRRPRLALVWVLIATGITVIALGLFVFLFSSLVDSWRLGDAFDYFLGVGSLGWVPVSLIVVGTATTLATLVIAVVRRSSLRIEAQQAALATSTPLGRDTPERVDAG